MKIMKQKNRTDWLVIALTIAFICIGLLSIDCFLQKNEKIAERNQLLKVLSHEENIAERLRIEYKQRTNYKMIEEYVSENLSMKKLDKYQIEYIVKTVDNKSEVVKLENDDGIFSRISQVFSIIASYFDN